MKRFFKMLFTKKTMSSLFYNLKRVLFEHLYKKEIEKIFICLANNEINKVEDGIKYLRCIQSTYLYPTITKCEVLINRCKKIGK